MTSYFESSLGTSYWTDGVHHNDAPAFYFYKLIIYSQSEYDQRDSLVSKINSDFGRKLQIDYLNPSGSKQIEDITKFKSKKGELINRFVIHLKENNSFPPFNHLIVYKEGTRPYVVARDYLNMIKGTAVGVIAGLPTVVNNDVKKIQEIRKMAIPFISGLVGQSVDISLQSNQFLLSQQSDNNNTSNWVWMMYSTSIESRNIIRSKFKLKSPTFANMPLTIIHSDMIEDLYSQFPKIFQLQYHKPIEDNVISIITPEVQQMNQIFDILQKYGKIKTPPLQYKIRNQNVIKTTFEESVQIADIINKLKIEYNDWTVMLTVGPSGDKRDTRTINQVYKQQIINSYASVVKAHLIQNDNPIVIAPKIKHNKVPSIDSNVQESKLSYQVKIGKNPNNNNNITSNKSIIPSNQNKADFSTTNEIPTYYSNIITQLQNEIKEVNKLLIIKQESQTTFENQFINLQNQFIRISEDYQILKQQLAQTNLLLQQLCIKQLNSNDSEKLIVSNNNSLNNNINNIISTPTLHNNINNEDSNNVLSDLKDLETKSFPITSENTNQSNNSQNNFQIHENNEADTTDPDIISITSSHSTIQQLPIHIINNKSNHWTAIHINCNNSVLEFYDSFGQGLPDLLYDKFKTLNLLIQSHNSHHQNDDVSCALYSLQFLQLKSVGATFDEIQQLECNDEALELLHNQYKLLFIDNEDNITYPEFNQRWTSTQISFVMKKIIDKQSNIILEPMDYRDDQTYLKYINKSMQKNKKNINLILNINLHNIEQWFNIFEQRNNNNKDDSDDEGKGNKDEHLNQNNNSSNNSNNKISTNNNNNQPDNNNLSNESANFRENIYDNLILEEIQPKITVENNQNFIYHQIIDKHLIQQNNISSISNKKKTSSINQENDVSTISDNSNTMTTSVSVNDASTTIMLETSTAASKDEMAVLNFQIENDNSHHGDAKFEQKKFIVNDLDEVNSKKNNLQSEIISNIDFFQKIGCKIKSNNSTDNEVNDGKSHQFHYENTNNKLSNELNIVENNIIKEIMQPKCSSKKMGRLGGIGEEGEENKNLFKESSSDIQASECENNNEKVEIKDNSLILKDKNQFLSLKNENIQNTFINESENFIVNENKQKYEEDSEREIETIDNFEIKFEHIIPNNNELGEINQNSKTNLANDLKGFSQTNEEYQQYNKNKSDKNQHSHQNTEKIYDSGRLDEIEGQDQNKKNKKMENKINNFSNVTTLNLIPDYSLEKKSNKNMNQKGGVVQITNNNEKINKKQKTITNNALRDQRLEGRARKKETEVSQNLDQSDAEIS